MRVFVTGATGFIGSARRQGIDRGRPSGARASPVRTTRRRPLAAAGAEVHRGSLDDLDSLKDGAARLGWRHPPGLQPRLLELRGELRDDRRVIEALGSALAGSDRPLIVTSGTGIATPRPAEPATEDDATVALRRLPRAASEEAAADAAAHGVNVSVVRLPQVHDTVKQGLISPCDRICSRKGRLRLCRRRAQSLAGGACFRCRPPLPAGDRKGRAGREISRGRRRRRADARHRRSHRPRA